MFNEFEALVRHREAETLNGIAKETCRSCGIGVLKNYRKVTVVGLLAGAGICSACSFQAFIKAKEPEISVDLESLAKLPKILVSTATNGATLTFGTLALSSGDSQSLAVNISKQPPYTQEVDDVSFSAEPQSVFDDMVHKNGSETQRSLQNMTHDQKFRFYAVGSGCGAREFFVKIA